MTQPVSNPVRVLLIEDNPSDAYLVRKRLEDVPDASYEIGHVDRCDDALRALAESAYDVVVADLNLPDAQGTNTIARLGTATAGVPIVVLTEIDDEELALGCIAAGAQDYLRKDEIAPVTLRRTIGFAVSRSREARIRELEEALTGYRSMSSSRLTPHATQSLAGAGPVRSRVPDEFEALQDEYRVLFDKYLRQLLVKATKPLATMSRIASQLGDLGGGPRDLVELHVGALETSVHGKPDARSRAYVIEGRLLALEMMGLLVDYYRVRIRRSSIHGDSP